MKTCTKCGETKRLSEFYSARARCKCCVRAESSAYSKSHRKEQTARNREWQSKNIDKVRASCAKWGAAHRDVLNNAARKWKALNPESKRVLAHNRRARKRANGGRLSPGLADKLFKLQRGKCACCGVSIADGNHMDHVIPLALNGPNEDWNIQLLCGPCNLSKGARHPIDFMQSRGLLL